MKNRFTIGMLICLTILALAGLAISEPINVDAPIREVTVYHDQARITRIAELTLAAGDQTLVIENLPAGLPDVSLRASASGVEGITMLGFTLENVQREEAVNEKMERLREQIKAIEENEKPPLEDRAEVLETQKNLLTTIIQNIGQSMTQQAVTGEVRSAEWDAAYRFIGTRLNEVNDSIRITKRNLQKIIDRQTQLQADHDELWRQGQMASKTVKVDLHLNKPGAVKLALEYIMPHASWNAIYDARLNPQKDQVDLNYYATVQQLTGEDWKDVKLSFSTMIPSQGIGLGEFNPWFLAIRAGFDKEYGNAASGVIARRDEIRLAEVQNIKTMNASDIKSMPIEHTMASLDKAQIIADGTVFQATRSETVISGGQVIRAPIGGWTLSGKLSLISRPREREGIFRTMLIVNQDAVPLIPGAIALYVESDFIGTSVIRDFVSPRDSFELPFGPDNNISIRREIVSYKKGIDGDKASLAQTIKITVTNHATKEKIIKVEEPLPVSRDGQIKVKLGQTEPQLSLPPATEKALWLISLAAGEKKELTISYKIEYPQTLQISGL